MKRLIVIASLILATTSMSFARGKKIKNVEYWGVDFTAVNVIGANESDQSFIKTFKEVNKLMLTEPKKYDVGDYLDLDVEYVDIDYMLKRTNQLNDVDFRDNRQQKVDINEIISNYPKSKGYKLVIIASELNKVDRLGEFTAVLFMGDTKKIVSTTRFHGRAKGFGLRNFWAGAIYDGLDNL